MRLTLGTLLPICAALMASCLVARAAFVPVNFSAKFNRRLQDNGWESIGMDGALLSPSGTTTLGGVPFNIPVNGNNYWHSYQPGPGANDNNVLDDNQPRVLSIPVNIQGGSRIYTLMNTYWGVAYPLTYAKLEVFGTGGAYARFDLFGNVHFRDFNRNTYTESLNQIPVGTQQVLAWNNWRNPGGAQRLDRQQFDLGNAFLGQTLTELRLTDLGGYPVAGTQNQFQRVFLAGATVETVATLTVTLNPSSAVTAGAQWRLDGGAWQNSGATLAGFAAGNHTMTFKPVNGWVEPAAMQLTLAAGVARNITATYALASGSLQVSINPPAAVSAGAQWQVDFGAWQNSGSTVEGLTPVDHSLTFKPINGWIEPALQVVGVSIGATTTVTATYQLHPGLLQVIIDPAEARTAGAQWQVDGGGWFNSGDTAASLSPGNHTVAFKTIPLWNAPASQNAIVVSDAVTTNTATYAKMTGGLQVTLNPAAAVTAGAQWQVDGDTFQDSGTTLTNLTVGPHTLSFKSLSGWGTPAAQTVNINANFTIAASGTYTANPGSLQVTLTPPAAVSAGAQWQVDGSAWYDSGTTLNGVSAGNHSVVFKTINAWVTPAPQVVTVTSGNTTNVTGTYAPGIGSLTVNIFPSQVIALGAQWRVDGGAWQDSGATVTNLPSGTHTVTYQPVTGWLGPGAQSVNVPDGGTGGASGFYSSVNGSLMVTLLPSGAVTAGAQWQVDGGAWLDSGATASGLVKGSHTISFKPVPGWGTPADQTVTIYTGATTLATGTYGGAAGTLTVTLTPQGAVAAGAQWQLDGGPFQNSSTTLSNLSSGDHTIAFKAIAAWNTPTAQTVTINTSMASTASANYYPMCAADGLVAWWKANDNALDTIGTNHAILSGGVTYQPGAIDNAFQFDGSSGNATVDASPTLNVGIGSGLTLTAWIHPDVLGDNQTIMEWNSGVGIPGYGAHFVVGGFFSSSSLYANLFSGTNYIIEAPSVILPGQWQHVAVTYDHATGLAVLYWNGIAVKTEQFGAISPKTDTKFYIGWRPYRTQGESPFWFHGGMDNLQIYNRALSADEVLLSSADCDAGGTANFYVTRRNPNSVYGYQINPQAAVLTRVLNDSAHSYVAGLALSPQGEMFVGSVGNDQALLLPGFIRRYGEPYTYHQFAGQIGADTLLEPHALDFLGDDLLVVDTGNNRVRRYGFAANGDPVEKPGIVTGLSNHDARGVVVRPDGHEVFVSQCYCSGDNDVHRYRVESDGTFTHLGTLPGSFRNPHFMAFSPWGELFVPNPDLVNGQQDTNWFISRYTFAVDGTPQYNGSFNDPHLRAPIALAFSPWGELIAGSALDPLLARFTFDANHQPVYHGTIPLPAPGGQMVFTPVNGQQTTLTHVPLQIFKAPEVNSYRLKWGATPGSLYQIEYSDETLWWRPISGSIQAVTNLENWTDPGPPTTDIDPSLVSKRFYRLFELGPQQ